MLTAEFGRMPNYGATENVVKCSAPGLKRLRQASVTSRTVAGELQSTLQNAFTGGYGRRRGEKRERRWGCGR